MSIKGTFFCVDAHTCGNPVRLVTSGHPHLNGRTMSEKRQDFMANHDWIRQALMFEPRGHDMMSGVFLYPPCDPNNDVAILFIETSGCLPMCGHGTIGAITAGIEQGLIQPKLPGIVKAEVPAGTIDIFYSKQGNKVKHVRIVNVPSFLAHQDEVIHIQGLGELRIDVAYGGNYYAIVEPQRNFPGIDQWTAAQILHYSPLVRRAASHLACVHPLDSTVAGVSHVLWTGKAKKADSDGANAVFYGNNAIDRSPCGTGTSARMAQLFAKGKLQLGQSFVHESYIGSQFVGRVEALSDLAGQPAIIPSIQGWAKILAFNCILVDDDDPYAHGFQVI